MEKQLSLLKQSRTGKKSAITKRVQHLERLVEESDSRRLIMPLLDGLRRVFVELCEVCDHISRISSVVEDKNCLEENSTNVETSILLIEDHLDDRRDEPPSTRSMTNSWVQKHSNA